MNVLKREDFKGRVSSRPTVVGEVEVPALGGKVHLAKLSAGGKDRVTSALLNLGKKNGHYRARLVLETACDEHGNKLFTEEDLDWLTGLEADLLEPIFDEARRLNDPEERDPAKN